MRCKHDGHGGKIIETAIFITFCISPEIPEIGTRTFYTNLKTKTCVPNCLSNSNSLD